MLKIKMTQFHLKRKLKLKELQEEMRSQKNQSKYGRQAVELRTEIEENATIVKIMICKRK